MGAQLAERAHGGEVARQPIARELEVLDARQRPDLLRQAARDAIVGECKLLEAGEGAERRRERARDIVLRDAMHTSRKKERWEGSRRVRRWACG